MIEADAPRAHDAASRPPDGPGPLRAAGSAPGPLPQRRRHRPLGLAARVTTTFALGALVLSGALASITYFSVRSSLLNQDRTSSTHEAIANAEAVQGDIEQGSSYPSALAAVGTESILEQDGAWFPSSQAVQESTIPAELRTLVIRGHLADELVDLSGHPVIIVGVPFELPAAQGSPATAEHVAYFEVFAMSEVSGTLRTLLGSLVLAAIVTTLGGAVVGRWGARRALRPLRQTAKAALSIAGGQLDTRLATDAYSDLAVLTSAFNTMADRLQERIEREVRFTSDVNHELRSPLTTVATALSVLESRREELPERSRQALDLLSAEVRRFRRLVDDLLEISRLDAGLGDVNSEEVSLGPLVVHAVAATGCDVAVDIAPGVGRHRVVADKLRFERVVANLLENANRYAGGATRVTLTADGKWARLAVEDHGPGIPDDERGLIFNRFSRGSSARRRGSSDGTGLGLAIVAEHARLLGGRVFVEPNEPSGARFVVELPLVSSGIPSTAVPAEPAAGGARRRETRPTPHPRVEPLPAPEETRAP